jgi:hypothetical protein
MCKLHRVPMGVIQTDGQNSGRGATFRSLHRERQTRLEVFNSLEPPHRSGVNAALLPITLNHTRSQSGACNL